jgi:hypothetical protein
MTTANQTCLRSSVNHMRRIIGWFWLLTGVSLACLGMWLVFSDVTAMRHHLTTDIYGSVLLCAAGLVGTLGGYGTLRHRRWAVPLLCIVCVPGILYGGFNLIFIGLTIDYMGWGYAAAVIGFAIASLATVAWAVSASTDS